MGSQELGAGLFGAFLRSLTGGCDGMRRINRFLAIAGMSLLTLTSSSAWATQVNYEAVPTTWLLQDYIGSPAGVVLWRMPLPNNNCYNSGVGTTGLSFPSTVTDQEANRFWSLVLTAKAANIVIGVWYDNSTCLISSFYIPNLGG